MPVTGQRSVTYSGSYSPPGGLMAIGLFFVLGWLHSARSFAPYQRVGPISVPAGGTAQAADFDKSPDRERKSRQHQDVMQHRACGSRQPCRFCGLAEHAWHQIKHQEPPRAPVAVMQPLGGDGETPKQPGDQNQDDHDDKEWRGNAGGGEQDHGGHQPRGDEDENRAPVFGAVDAPAGAEQKFEQAFHSAPCMPNAPTDPAHGILSLGTRNGFKKDRIMLDAEMA